MGWRRTHRDRQVCPPSAPDLWLSETRRSWPAHPKPAEPHALEPVSVHAPREGISGPAWAQTQAIAIAISQLRPEWFVSPSRRVGCTVFTPRGENRRQTGGLRTSPRPPGVPSVENSLIFSWRIKRLPRNVLWKARDQQVCLFQKRPSP